ncbi:MAG: HAD-superfamily hydrolase, partial [Parcubacteria group bacterium Gr01-1014_44]
MLENKPLHKIENKHKKAKLIIFDLDGTLAPSKSDMDAEMAELIKKLLEKKMVAVISGGSYEQFQKQFLAKLTSRPRFDLSENPRSNLLKNLFLFPTSGSTFYRYAANGWQEVYAENLSEEEKRKVFEAFTKTFQESNHSHPEKTYGKVIEDRGTQITFSAVGQEAPLEVKGEWNKAHHAVRLKLATTLQTFLPDLEVQLGGLTSIDVTCKGIDKEYGIRQIKKHLGIDFNEMLFVGDALFPGGNDYAAVRT